MQPTRANCGRSIVIPEQLRGPAGRFALRCSMTVLPGWLKARISCPLISYRRSLRVDRRRHVYESSSSSASPLPLGIRMRR